MQRDNPFTKKKCLDKVILCIRCMKNKVRKMVLLVSALSNAAAGGFLNANEGLEKG